LENSEFENTPFPPGHHLLVQFAKALEDEYDKEKQAAVGKWIERLKKDEGVTHELEANHTHWPGFERWVEMIEQAMSTDATSVSELRVQWGVPEPEEHNPVSTDQVPVAFAPLANAPVKGGSQKTLLAER